MRDRRTPAPPCHPPLDRRTFLKRASSAVGAALVASASPQAGARALPEPPATAAGPWGAPDGPLPWSVQGRPVSPYGERSKFETAVRVPFNTPTTTSSWTFTPLHALHGIITPSSLHFERHHAGVPDIDPGAHRLMIHGLVRRPVVFTMADLYRFPSISRIYFIECSGNSLTEWPKPTMPDAQQAHGLVSCSEWTGVPLSTLLEYAGLDPAARWVVAEGADAALMTRSIPIEKCMADALVAYGQNGEALRPEQGYPLRLVLPGFEGNTQIKWLRRLKVVREPYYTREETSKYTDLMPDGTARKFSLEMEAKSVITFPSGQQRLPGPGPYEITGLAWSGRAPVTAVEVTTDGGRSWRPAQLQEPVLPFALVRFRLPWSWDGRETTIASRGIDATGYVQPPREMLVAVRGTRSVYHYNGIQPWRIASDGSVSNV